MQNYCWRKGNPELIRGSQKVNNESWTMASMINKQRYEKMRHTTELYPTLGWGTMTEGEGKPT